MKTKFTFLIILLLLSNSPNILSARNALTDNNRISVEHSEEYHTPAEIAAECPDEVLNNTISTTNATVMCAGQIISFTGTIPAITPSTDSTFQWQSKTVSGSWQNISGATEINYTTESLSETMSFRRLVEFVGCASEYASNEILITVNTVPSAPMISVADSCGESVLTASGESGATFTWSTTETGESINVATAGIYTVTQTVNGCTSDAASATAAPKSIPTLAVTSTNPTECQGMGSLEFTFTNVPDGTYAISYDFSTFADVEVADNAATVQTPAGTYNNLSISVDGCASATGINASLSDPNPPNTPTISVENNCGESVLTASGETGATFTWSTTETSESITVATAGIYTVTQTVDGCTSDAASATAAPKSIPTLTVTSTNPTECQGMGSLEFTFTNVPDGTYAISYDFSTFADVEVADNAATVQTPAGTYNNLSISVDGCASATGINASLSDPNPPNTPTISVENNCGESVLTASGESGATFTWSTTETGESITVATAGIYTVTQTVNGCTSDAASATAAPKSIPTLAVTSTNPTECQGMGELSFTFTNVPDGTYSISYDFSTFAGVEVADNAATVQTPAGTYNNLSISVDGCTSATGINASLSDPKPPNTPTISVENNCGESVLTASGETGATFTWSTTETGESIIVTTGGTYTVTQTVNGCTSDAASATAAPKSIPTLAVTSTNPTECQGMGELSFTFTNVPDGTYSISYDFNTFAGVEVADNTATVQTPAGTYNNLSISVDGCTSATGINASLSDPNPPNTPTISVENNCGESVLTASGETGATFTWSTTETGESITVATAGIYTVTQTVNGCTSDAASATAAPKSIPTLAVTSTNPTECQEMGELSFTFTNVPDGTYAISYDFSTFSGVEVADNAATVQTPAGTYNNLSISLDGCASATGINASLSDPNPPNTPTISVENNCGESVLTASGESGATFTWSTTETGESITVATAGIYTVTQTINGCTSDAASATAAPKSIPTLAVTSTNPTECQGMGELSFTFTNVPDGTYSISYDFSTFSGVEVVDNAATVQTPAGTYNNLSISVDGCTSATGINASLSDPNPPNTPTISVENNCGESVLTASGESGATFTWSTTETGESITVATAGIYTVTQTVNGCTSDAASATAAPKSIPTLAVTSTNPTACQGMGSLEFTFTNVPDGTYAISYDFSTFADVEVADNAATVQTPAGTYNNLSISVDGCTSATGINASLSDPNPPNTPTISVENNCGESVLTASGETGATFTWSTTETGESIIVTTGGTYTVTQTVDGCTSDAASATAAPKSIPTLAVTSTNPTECQGMGELSFTFTNVPDGTYAISYDFSTFADVEVADNAATVQTPAGTYNNLSISVDGCTSATGINASLSDPNPPNTPTISVENNCGESVLTASGETGATFTWSTTETSESITVATAGIYTVTQTVDGCTSDAASATAAPKSIPTLTVTSTNPTECQGMGSLEFTFTNVPDGTYAISYDFSTFADVEVADNAATVQTPAGIYNNLSISVDGCTSATGINASLSDPNPPNTPTISVENNCGESVLTASGESGAAFTWSTTETGESITVATAGIYTVTQTVDGCTSDAASATAAPKSIPTLAVTSTNPTECQGMGELSFTFTNVPDGTYAISYDFSTFAGVEVADNAATVQTPAGTYNNLSISVDGCTSATGINASLSDPNPPNTPTISVENNCGESVLTASGESGVTFTWSTTETGERITVATAGIYTVTQTVNGCTSDAASATAAPKSIPTLAVSPIAPTECGGQGMLIFSFTDVPNGNYSIDYDRGNFSGVEVADNAATVQTPAGTYSNLSISVDGCASITGINAILADPDPPSAPTISVENNCGESVLTASGETGATFTWSTTETGESITVTTSGIYTVTQTVNGCTSDAASATAAPKSIPTLAVTPTNPTECQGMGSLEFTFTNVPNGTYSITYDGGSFSNVMVSNNSAMVESTARTYNNLTISVDGCISATGINTSLSEPNAPHAPTIIVQNNCGESVLTASNYEGTLTWDTGDITESITVKEAREYTLIQTVNGCTSNAASAIATPKTIPTLSISENYSTCLGYGYLDFIFTGVPDGTYLIESDDSAWEITVFENAANAQVPYGIYNNLTITVDGCTSANGVHTSIAEPPPPAAPNILVKDSCGESILSAFNYIGTLLWSTGDTTESIIVTESGSYSLTQTVEGCRSDAAEATATPKLIPTLAVTTTDPKECQGMGILDFTFTNVPNGTYSIAYDGGSFSNVVVSNNSAVVESTAQAYNNLTIMVDGCFSALAVSASLSDPNAPPAPTITVQDNYGESILTASGYTGSLEWNTGDTTETITVYTAGEYTLTQTVNGCTSAAASATANPKTSSLQSPEIEITNDCGKSTITIKNLAENAWFFWQYNTTSDSTKNETITITEEGEYTFTQKLNNQISPSKTVTISPFTIPSVPVGYDKEVCASEPIQTLIAEATIKEDNTIVIWYDKASGGNEVFPILDTVGTITFYAEALDTLSGCTSTGRIPVTLTTKSNPKLAFTDTTIVGKPYNNVAVLIFPNESFKYQWYLNDNKITNATNQFYYIFESDRKNSNKFAVEVELPNGCKAKFNYEYTSSSSTTAINAADGSVVTELGESFFVYPNPANSMLNIAIDSKRLTDAQKLTAKLYSVTGACVMEIPLTQNPQIINTGHLKPGLYSIAIFETNRRLYSTKITLTKY